MPNLLRVGRKASSNMDVEAALVVLRKGLDLNPDSARNQASGKGSRCKDIWEWPLNHQGNREATG